MADPIRILGTKGKIDRNGVITINADYLASSLEDVMAFLSEVDSLNGLPRVDADFDQGAAGEFVIHAVYEGLNPGDGGAGSDPSENLTEFIFEGTEEKVAIQTHRLFEKLKEKFGWDDENKVFPSVIPGGSSSQGGTGLGAKKPASTESPLAGVNSYYEAGAEYIVRYARRQIPPDLLRGIGTIVQQPRGIQQFNVPNPGGKRNWRKKAPRIIKRGNAVTIEERYELSGPRGWAEEIYGAGQLETLD